MIETERIETCFPLFIDISELSDKINKEWFDKVSKPRKYLVTNYFLKNLSYHWRSVRNGETEYYYLLEEILKNA